MKKDMDAMETLKKWNWLVRGTILFVFVAVLFTIANSALAAGTVEWVWADKMYTVIEGERFACRFGTTYYKRFTYKNVYSTKYSVVSEDPLTLKFVTYPDWDPNDHIKSHEIKSFPFPIGNVINITEISGSKPTASNIVFPNSGEINIDFTTNVFYLVADALAPGAVCVWRQDSGGVYYNLGIPEITKIQRTRAVISVISSEYSVNLDYNGAKAGANDETIHSVKYNHPYSYSQNLPEPTREGYNFLGWFTASSGGTQITNGTVFQDRDAIINKKTVTLYAHWELCGYDVNYHGNRDEVINIPIAQKKYYGQNLTLSGMIPECEGCNFLGWTDGNGTSYQPGDAYQSNAPLDLYAQWEELVRYRVAYFANGKNAMGIPSHQWKYQDMDITISDEIPTCDGFDFIGWGITSGEADVIYYPGDTYKTNATLTLYAMWVTKTYDIIYNGNGQDVSNVPEEDMKFHGESIRISSEIPIMEHAIFLGWAEKDEEGHIINTYRSGDIYTRDADIEFYGMWHEMSNAFIVPEELIEIEESAFSGISIDEIIIPSTVKKIGSEAFGDCQNLKYVYFENGDIDIANNIFNGCCSDMVIFAPDGSRVSNQIEAMQEYLK